MTQAQSSSRSKAVATIKAQSAELSVAEIKGRIQRIQQVMKAVMKKDVHFGIVPGTPKPSLWKPGSEVLCATFRIAPSFVIDNISDDDHYEFIVRCIGTHQDSGTVLGEGMGSASSNEKKYKWRAALSHDEYEATDEDRRRLEWKKVFENGRATGGVDQVEQIRTDPADIVNTILKMACKRAQIAMTINVLACSDIFAQDLEDLPDGHLDDDKNKRAGGKPETRQPRAAAAGGKPMSDGQVRLVNARLKGKGVQADALLAEFKLAQLEDLPMGQVNDALAWIDAGGKLSSKEPAAAEKPRATKSQIELITARMTSGKVDARKLCDHFKIAAIVEISADQVDAAIDWINANGA